MWLGGGGPPRNPPPTRPTPRPGHVVRQSCPVCGDAEGLPGLLIGYELGRGDGGAGGRGGQGGHHSCPTSQKPPIVHAAVYISNRGKHFSDQEDKCLNVGVYDVTQHPSVPNVPRQRIDEFNNELTQAGSLMRGLRTWGGGVHEFRHSMKAW